MEIPRFDEKKFLETLLLDEDRLTYNNMSKEQKKLVRWAYNFGAIDTKQNKE